MTHLGDRVSALVDGQLPLDARERAHAHLANCRDCRDAVEAERLMKARLDCLPAAQPGADLLARLLALGGPAGPLPPRPGHVPGTPRAEPVVLSAELATEGVRIVTAGGRTLEPVEFELVGAGIGSGSGAAREQVPHGGAALGSAVGSALALGPGRVPGRVVPARSAAARPGPSRPAGRSVGRRRARLAGAVLAALGVVGAGVGGLVLAAPAASGGSSGPGRAPLDSFVVQRDAPAPTGVSADVSLQLRPGRPFASPATKDGR